MHPWGGGGCRSWGPVEQPFMWGLNRGVLKQSWGLWAGMPFHKATPPSLSPDFLDHSSARGPGGGGRGF